MLYLFIGGYGPTSFDATHEMLTHQHTIPGLSDGGAHVGSICDGSFPTTLLQHWVRGPRRGQAGPPVRHPAPEPRHGPALSV